MVPRRDSSAPQYEFGPFRYDPTQRQLFREGQPVPLVPKAADMLHVLIEHRGRVVDKGELLRQVWPDTTVEEIGLARNISILRKALGDEGDSPRYIETIPRRGYRFAAAPAPPRGGRRWSFVVAALLAVLFIWWQFYLPSRYLPRGERMALMAALPFEMIDSKTLSPGYASALNELTVAELMRPGGIQVISPATVARYRRFGIPSGIMARVLGLDVILEGTVQEAGEQVRITARLADVHSGKLIWGESFIFSSSGSPAAQQEAARAIAAGLRERLVLTKP